MFHHQACENRVDKVDILKVEVPKFEWVLKLSISYFGIASRTIYYFYMAIMVYWALSLSTQALSPPIRVNN